MIVNPSRLHTKIKRVGAPPRLLVGTCASLAVAASLTSSPVHAAAIPAPLTAYVAVAESQLDDQAKLLVSTSAPSSRPYFPDIKNRAQYMSQRDQLLALGRRLDTTGVAIATADVRLTNCAASLAVATVEVACQKATDIEFGPLAQGQSVSKYVVQVQLSFSLDLAPKLLLIKLLPGDDAQKLPTDELPSSTPSSNFVRKPNVGLQTITTPSTFVGLTSSQKLLAVSYALEYAKVYNYDYPSYPKDCANFVSQAMRAAGWSFVGDGSYLQMTNTNYWNFFTEVYPVPSYVPYSWRVANAQYEFAVGASHRGLPLTTQLSAGAIANQTQLFPGDLVYITDDTGSIKTMNHVVIVTNRGSGIVKISSHNKDRLNMTFSDWVAAAEADSPSTVYYHFVRV